MVQFNSEKRIFKGLYFSVDGIVPRKGEVIFIYLYTPITL